jgi:ketosteroid isomerase-like protein
MGRSLDKDIEYINRMRAEIAEAENTPNDIEPLRRHSAPELVLMPEGMPPIEGRENALALMQQMWSMFDVTIVYDSEAVSIMGDTAIDRGSAKETLRNKVTGDSVDNLFNYLWISKRDENDVWKQTHVVWNKRQA